MIQHLLSAPCAVFLHSNSNLLKVLSGENLLVVISPFISLQMVRVTKPAYVITLPRTIHYSTIGVKFFFTKHLHLKAYITNRYIYLSSANFTRSYNQEFTVRVNFDCQLVQKILSILLLERSQISELLKVLNCSNLLYS